MTKAERAIKEASEKSSAYKYDISKYPVLASWKKETSSKKSTAESAKKNK